MIDGFCQTSDESMDEDSEESSSRDDDDEEETRGDIFNASTSTCINSYKSLTTKSILGRLTSAHIRQFVCPDFKQDLFNFHTPSLALHVNPNMKTKTRAKKIKEKLRNKVEAVIFKSSKTEIITNSIDKSELSIARQLRKRKNKIKKSILNRLCSPTISFILKTKLQDQTDQLASDSSHDSPCERYNRRNPNN